MAKARIKKQGRAANRSVNERAYLDRALFFLGRYDSSNLSLAIERVEALAKSPATRKLSWALTELGIEGSAWNWVAESGNSPVAYFCHPNIITADPPLLLFYRRIALLPQKGAGYLGLHTERFESGLAQVSGEQAIRLAAVLNRHISALLAKRKLDPQEMRNLAHVSLGAQIQGSWNNAIGNGATLNVMRILVGHWYSAGLVDKLLKKRVKKPIDAPLLPDLLESISDYFGIVFRNGSRAEFGAEPDAALRNPKGTLNAAIEIKGGTDPAGALERLGAAEKSFRAARSEDPKNPCKTILLMAAITDEVARRVSADPALFNSLYNLADLYVDGDKLQAFEAEVDEQLWL